MQQNRQFLSILVLLSSDEGSLRLWIYEKISAALINRICQIKRVDKGIGDTGCT